jgi:hypothetical protein
VHIERKRDFLRRHRKGKLHLSALTERAGRRLRARNHRPAQASAEPPVIRIVGSTEKLNRAKRGETCGGYPGDAGGVPPPDRQLVG